MKPKLIIQQACLKDAEELLTLQKAAFHQEAVFYNNFTITSLIETVDNYRTAFSEFTTLKAIIDSRIVGSVRAKIVAVTCHISRLVVFPTYQRQGIASRLIHTIEKRMENKVDRFELFTGAKSIGNIALYKNLDYRIVRTTENDGVPMVKMIKKVIFNPN